MHRFSGPGFGHVPRPILQTEAAECGLACIATVASHHGYDTDLPTLRRRFSLSLKGANLVRLIDIAAKREFSARVLRPGMEKLVQLATPCILHRDLNHFVVLVRADGRRVTILDPARGERTLRYAEASRRFTGMALEADVLLERRRLWECVPEPLFAAAGRV